MISNARVLVVDVGLGNYGSVIAAFKRECNHVERIKNPPDLLASDDWTHVVLPGVGSFFAGMNALIASGWNDWLVNCWCRNNRPLLGICLGMQLLATHGLEGCITDAEPINGLDLIPGRVSILPENSSFRLPHVGWNELSWHVGQHFLAANIPNGGDMYFVHSYRFDPDLSTSTIASTKHGIDFPAVVASGNCFGAQFHPEKSQRLGRQFLVNFLNCS